MTGSVTSLGCASGMDFQSIVDALVSSKETSLNSRLLESQEDTETEISGVATLKEALETFQDKLEELMDEDSFNKHTIKDDQDGDGCFSIEAEDDISNMEFSLEVVQLASAEKASCKITTTTTQTVTDEDGNPVLDENGNEVTEEVSTFNNSFAAGTITIDLGVDPDDDSDNPTSRTITVDVQEGDSLETIRKRINDNSYGVSCSLVSTDAGYTFSITSGDTGTNNSTLNITFETASKYTDADGNQDTGDYTTLESIFGSSYVSDDYEDGDETPVSSNSYWATTEAKDAIIKVDGDQITSNTNTFENAVAGITITAKKVSAEDEDNGGNKIYNVTIGTDTDTVVSKMEEFVSAYNTLMETIDELTASNTYTDGVSNEDGGDLANDSSTKNIANAIQSIITRFSKTTNIDGVNMTIFNCGIEFNSDGTIELDSDAFKDALEENFNDVIGLFANEDGLFDTLNEYIKDYTKSAGILDQRTDSLESTADSIQERLDRNEERLSSYEDMLNAKYSAADTAIANYSNALNYL